MRLSDERRNLLASIGLAFAVGVFALAAAGMSRRMEPFYSWYYCFAWWPAILAGQSALRLARGRSLLFDDPKFFAGLLPLSLTLWLIFEAFNFRLENWHYLGLPANLPLRWLGYVLSYSSVLPGLATAADVLDHLGLFRNARCAPLQGARNLHLPLVLAGLVSLVLVLAWPRFFFPLTWGFAVFLLEPWLNSHGADSLLSDWQAGKPRRFLLLASAGLLCGLLWELWNFHAGAKWVYDLPVPAGPKLFEMPLLGFLGFPPFALECFCLTSAFFVLRRRISVLPPSSRRLAWLAVVLCVLAFDVWVLRGIDRWTVLVMK